MDESQKLQNVLEPMLNTRTITTQDLPLDLIHSSPFQGRQHFSEDDLEELAHSIHEHGLLEPIRVRPDPSEKGFYQLVYGERRLLASRRVGRTTIPCYIGNYTDEETAELGIIENLQRKSLTPWEEGVLFRRLLDQGNKRYSSVRKLAEHIGKDKDYVAQRLALLRLPDDVKEVLEVDPHVSLRALTEVAKLPTPEAREPLIRQLKTGMMSTEDVRTIVQEILTHLRSRDKASPNPQEQVDPLVYTRALNRTKRRMRSAIKELTKTMQIFQVTYGTVNKETLLEYVQETLEEIQQIKETLRGIPSERVPPTGGRDIKGKS